MSSSNKYNDDDDDKQSIQQVVDQLLLSGTLYDDLIRTLGTKMTHCCRLPQRNKGWWTSSELLLELPELRLFFQSNRTFPPSNVLALCPNVQCVTTTTPQGQPATYFMRQDLMMDRSHHARELEAEPIIHEQELPNQVSWTADDDNNNNNNKAKQRINKKIRHGKALLAFENQLVKLIQSAPGQRIMKAQLQAAYELTHGNKWKKVEPGSKFSQLVRALLNPHHCVPRLKVTMINGTLFTVLQSFDPAVDTPTIHQDVMDQLEEELVELLRSTPGQRLKLSQGILENAYQIKYNKPLQVESTGYFRLKNVVQAMTRVRYNHQGVVLASKNKQSSAPPPSQSGLPPPHAAAVQSGLPPGLPPLLSGFTPVVQSTVAGKDVPKLISQQLVRETALYKRLCEFIRQNGPVDVPTLVQGCIVFRRFVKDHAKRLGFPNVSFTAVLNLLPHIQEMDRRHHDGQRLFAYVE